jgi:uncharacterized protein GlcG (DUF336 family)
MKEAEMELFDIAKKIATIVEEEARTAKVPVSVTVIDTHGNVVLKHRLTGALFISLEMSERKAYTSALVGMQTKDVTPLVQPGQPLFTLTEVGGGRYCAIGGGMPIEDRGALVAGVGVSGGSVDQDVAIIEAAMKRFKSGE